MGTALLVLLGGLALLGWILTTAAKGLDRVRIDVAEYRKRKQKWAGRAPDRSLPLELRNEDIIRKHVAALRSDGTRWHYLDDAVRDCIQDIAEAEEKPSMMPRRTYLRQWLTKAEPEYATLAQSLRGRFQLELDARRESAARREAGARREALEALCSRHADIIRQFYEIAERRVSLADDYGEENWDSLPKEVEVAVRKIAKRENVSDGDLQRWRKHEWERPDLFASLAQHLEETFREYHEEQSKGVASETDVGELKGTEFESYLTKLLVASGFTDVRGTPATGDQGADLIATWSGRRIAIQAKRYAGAVGNKAVQEVVGAVHFYSADEGWVVTNSRFTKAAKDLAQKSGVILVDGRDLARFADFLSTRLSP